jgi:hypothetical protein
MGFVRPRAGVDAARGTSLGCRDRAKLCDHVTALHSGVVQRHVPWRCAAELYHMRPTHGGRGGLAFRSGVDTGRGSPGEALGCPFPTLTHKPTQGMVGFDSETVFCQLGVCTIRSDGAQKSELELSGLSAWLALISAEDVCIQRCMGKQQHNGGTILACRASDGVACPP